MLLSHPPHASLPPSPFLTCAMLTSDPFLSPSHSSHSLLCTSRLPLPPPSGAPFSSPLLFHLPGSSPHLNLDLIGLHIYRRNQQLHVACQVPSAPAALEGPPLAFISDFWLTGCLRALICVSAGGRAGHGAEGTWGRRWGRFPSRSCPCRHSCG